MTKLVQRLQTPLWAACLIAAFVATHLPPSELPSTPWLSDKVEHIVGYFGLGFITAWRFRQSLIPPSAIRKALVILGCLCLYAAFDELTQPWFGRSAELADGLADLAGASIGISVYLVYHGLSRRLRG